MKITIGVNDGGYRVGEDHPSARLTEHEVDLLLTLRDEGWGYRRLSRHFEISKTAVRKICAGVSRCQRAARWKEVHLVEGD